MKFATGIRSDNLIFWRKFILLEKRQNYDKKTDLHFFVQLRVEMHLAMYNYSLPSKLLENYKVGEICSYRTTLIFLIHRTPESQSILYKEYANSASLSEFYSYLIGWKDLFLIKKCVDSIQALAKNSTLNTLSVIYERDYGMYHIEIPQGKKNILQLSNIYQIFTLDPSIFSKQHKLKFINSVSIDLQLYEEYYEKTFNKSIKVNSMNKNQTTLRDLNNDLLLTELLRKPNSAQNKNFQNSLEYRQFERNYNSASSKFKINSNYPFDDKSVYSNRKTKIAQTRIPVYNNTEENTTLLISNQNIIKDGITSTPMSTSNFTNNYNNTTNIGTTIFPSDFDSSPQSVDKIYNTHLCRFFLSKFVTNSRILYNQGAFMYFISQLIILFLYLSSRDQQEYFNFSIRIFLCICFILLVTICLMFTKRPFLLAQGISFSIILFSQFFALLPYDFNIKYSIENSRRNTNKIWNEIRTPEMIILDAFGSIPTKIQVINVINYAAFILMGIFDAYFCYDEQSLHSKRFI